MRLLPYFVVCFLCVPAAMSQVQITAKPGYFNAFSTTPTSVYGIAPVANTSNRSYYKIWKPDLTTVKVQEYDAAGVVTDTDVYRFNRGFLTQETQTNEWGNTYQVDRYTQSGQGQMVVTAMRNG